MPHSLIIPSYQPVPFPAPLWLLEVLIVLGFFLHALPMNMVWLGGPIAALLMGANRRNPDSHGYRAGKRLAFSLPVFLSFAITQGIVPLLFLQLVYGPAYYTSSMLMAWPWLAVLGILLVGYYCLYIFKLKGEALDCRSLGLLWLAFGLFASIAWLFVSNISLMHSPERWVPLATGGVTGAAVNLLDPAVLPRYLHFATGALTVAGMGLGCFGIYYDHRDKAYSQWWIRSGAGLFLAGTLVSVLTGGWFLMTLPRPMMLAYMGQNTLATAAFGGSMVCSIIALVSALLAWRSGGLRAMQVTVGAGMLSVLGMVVMRHMLRVLTLHPLLKPEVVPVQTQWDLLIAFVIFAVLLVGYLIWLSRLAFRAFEPDADTPAPVTREAAPV